MDQFRQSFVTIFAALSCGAVATAQDWRVEAVPEAGIEIEAPSRLERLPLPQRCKNCQQYDGNSQQDSLFGDM